MVKLKRFASRYDKLIVPAKKQYEQAIQELKERYDIINPSAMYEDPRHFAEVNDEHTCKLVPTSAAAAELLRILNAFRRASEQIRKRIKRESK